VEPYGRLIRNYRGDNMPLVFIKGKGARKLKKHLNKEHPELKHVVILPQRKKKGKK